MAAASSDSLSDPQYGADTPNGQAATPTFTTAAAAAVEAQAAQSNGSLAHKTLLPLPAASGALKSGTLSAVPTSVIECLLKLERPGFAPGVHRVLINSLYDAVPAEVEAMLPQIVHVAVTYRCGTSDCGVLLRKYLLHLAASSVYLGMRLAWIVESVTPMFEQSGLKNEVANLGNAIENATIRGTPGSAVAAATAASAAAAAPVGGRGSSPPAATPELMARLAEDTARKQRRSELFNAEQTFLKTIIEFSNKLVAVPDRPQRKIELRRQLEGLNATLGSKTVLFPLPLSCRERARRVVSIAVGECTVFSSRERAPYLLVLETVEIGGGVTYADADATVSTSTSPERQRFETGGPGVVTSGGLRARRSHTRISTGDFESDAARDGSLGCAVPSPLSPAPSQSISAAVTANQSIGLLNVVFGETPEDKAQRVRASSPYGTDPTWRLDAIVVKAGDDLRQEQLALQLIALFNTIWVEAGVTCAVRPYSCAATEPSAGVIACVSDALSIDSVKKAAQVQSLNQFFHRAYGGADTKAFATAQRNFVETMAAYSVICYLLQIKDRHNGNLLLSREGHLIHIDFGFMLATSPGGINFEQAPFKLSQELLAVMGGVNSAAFNYFKVLTYQGFRAARERAEEILACVELMMTNTTLPCFGSDPAAIVAQLRTRFKLDLTDIELAVEIKRMVDDSVNNWRTQRYDQFQTWQNGII